MKTQQNRFTGGNMKTAIRLYILTFTLVMVIACTEEQAVPDSPSAFIDIQGPYLGQALPGNVPEVFAPDLISTWENETGLIVHPNENEIYFSRMKQSNNGITGTIFCTRVVNGFWTEPEALYFSGSYQDFYIAMHPDGSRIYFQSDRPIDPSESEFEWNIWYTRRDGDTWQPPMPIGFPINGQAHTSGPSVTRNGTMYFTNMILGGLNELYRSVYSNGRYQQPVRLPDRVNGVEAQFDSYIAPDESYLIFCSDQRPDTFGSTDLYVTFRNNGNWSEPVNMGSTVNSTEVEGSATITPDGRFIFFTKLNNSGNQRLDVYWVSTGIIDDLRELGR
jgi:hypothetical protein